MKTILLPIEITDAGFPAVWEKGGLLFEGGPGAAMVVTGRDGQKKKPIFVNNKSKARDQKHALFVLKEGDCLLLHYHGGNYNGARARLVIYRFIRITLREDNESPSGQSQGMFEVVYDSTFPAALLFGAMTFVCGKRARSFPNEFNDAAEAVMTKSYTEEYIKPVYYEFMTRTKAEEVSI